MANKSTSKKPEINKDKSATPQDLKKSGNKSELPEEFGGQQGPEPTRYGDWEKGGRCTDF